VLRLAPGLVEAEAPLGAVPRSRAMLAEFGARLPSLVQEVSFQAAPLTDHPIDFLRAFDDDVPRGLRRRLANAAE
jgi:hypothetical protein